MPDETCGRTYPSDPDTAEDPCEDCGRDQRKHEQPLAPKMWGNTQAPGQIWVGEKPPLAPVVPIAPVQVCAGCGSRHTHEERFKVEAHAEGCPQPEIRFRRAERQIAHLLQVVEQLATSNNESVQNIVDLNKRLEALESK